jgi:hypothetical protein
MEQPATTDWDPREVRVETGMRFGSGAPSAVGGRVTGEFRLINRPRKLSRLRKRGIPIEQVL